MSGNGLWVAPEMPNPSLQPTFNGVPPLPAAELKR